MFKKILVVALGVLLLLPLPGLAISDIGRPELTRLWVSTPDGYRFVCTASYIHPPTGVDSISYVLTAGHCTSGDLISRNRSKTLWGVVHWFGQVETHGEAGVTKDIAIGRVPDLREQPGSKFWLADTMPDQGRAYAHSFPAGVEVVTEVVIAPLEAAGYVSFQRRTMTPFGSYTQQITIAEAFPGTRFVVVPPGRLGPGASGSPILDTHDRVIAVLWGGLRADHEIQGLPPAFQGWDVILVTPVDGVHDLLKSTGIEK